MPLRLYNNCASTFTTGWTNSLQQDSDFIGAKMIQGFYRFNSTTTYTHSILCSNQYWSDETPLWLNCYHGDTVNWDPGYKFAPVGGDTITRRIFVESVRKWVWLKGYLTQPKRMFDVQVHTIMVLE